jgi:hypothetical protein
MRIIEYQDRISYFNDDNQLHRLDGPALINKNPGPGNMKEAYIVNGAYHREDGPAIIWGDGDRWFYLNGIRMIEINSTEKLIKFLKLKAFLVDKNIFYYQSLISSY